MAVPYLVIKRGLFQEIKRYENDLETESIPWWNLIQLDRSYQSVRKKILHKSWWNLFV